MNTKKLFLKTAYVLTVLNFSGCASTPEDWKPITSTPTDINTAFNYCREYSVKHGGPNEETNALIAGLFIALAGSAGSGPNSGTANLNNMSGTMKSVNESGMLEKKRPSVSDIMNDCMKHYGWGEK